MGKLSFALGNYIVYGLVWRTKSLHSCILLLALNDSPGRVLKWNSSNGIQVNFCSSGVNFD